MIKHRRVISMLVDRMILEPAAGSLNNSRRELRIEKFARLIDDN